MVQGPKKGPRITRRHFWEVLEVRTLKSCLTARALGGRGQSAVDRDDRTADKTARPRGEVDGDAREIVRMSHAFHGRIIDDLLRAMLVDRIGHFRREVAGRDRINRNVLWRK